MKIPASIAPVAACLAFASASAQFPQVWQHPATLQTISSLGSGMRFIEPMNYGATTSTRIIRNMDLSIHRTLNIPAPPPDMQWNSMSYITEELFDTDPTTIEFVMVAGQTDGPGNFATFVFREDGTELFSQNPGSFVASLGLNGSAPIFMVDGQTYMLLYTDFVLGPPSRLYALPGTLPCMDCHGMPTISGIGLGLGDGPAADGASGFTLFPNPASATVQVDLGTLHATALQLFDAEGRLVRVLPLNGQPRTNLATDGLASGRYLVVAEHNGRSVGALPLVIER